ncbi:MAG: phosphate-starvation-inducible PsiE family protein [Ktedonobacterales bacterium]|nr:phosphate-starvation-inducible PsiE family protein [Ktedonobacterales bacterium]
MHSLGRRHRVRQHYQKIPNPIRRASLQVLDGLDIAVYIIVGTAFVIAAIMALIFSLLNLGHHFGFSTLVPDFGTTVLDFVSDLLLVLIIMEVLGTIRSYLEHGDTSVKPFIFIGIISATRGILSIGARLSIAGGSLTPDEFRNNMIELGVNAAIIIALGSTLRIMGNTAEAPDDDLLEDTEEEGDVRIAKS